MFKVARVDGRQPFKGNQQDGRQLDRSCVRYLFTLCLIGRDIVDHLLHEAPPKVRLLREQPRNLQCSHVEGVRGHQAVRLQYRTLSVVGPLSLYTWSALHVLTQPLACLGPIVTQNLAVVVNAEDMHIGIPMQGLSLREAEGEVLRCHEAA